MGMPGQQMGGTVEQRLYQVETDVRYFKSDVTRQIDDLRKSQDNQFREIKADIKAISVPHPPSTPDFRDPRQWFLVILGVIGGGAVFIAALWMALGGMVR